MLDPETVTLGGPSALPLCAASAVPVAAGVNVNRPAPLFDGGCVVHPKQSLARR